MARAKKTKPTAWSVGKAKPSRKKTAVAKKPEIPDTKDDLLLQIGKLLDNVDTVLASRKSFSVSFSRWDETVRDQKRAAEDLVARLDKILDGDVHAADVIKETFGAAPGTVPSWTRPGTFVLWIDYIPCRCIWGGFIDPAADVVAVDPAAKWFAPSGAISTQVEINRHTASVEGLFRNFLTAQTERRIVKQGRAYNSTPKDLGPGFNLHRLADLGKEAAEKELARNPWLLPILKRGPVNPIPLPPHLAFVQMSWV